MKYISYDTLFSISDKSDDYYYHDDDDDDDDYGDGGDGGGGGDDDGGGIGDTHDIIMNVYSSLFSLLRL